MWDKIKAFGDWVAGGFSDAWGIVWPIIETVATAVWDAIKVAAQFCWDLIKKVSKWIGGAFKTAWDAVWPKVKYPT